MNESPKAEPVKAEPIICESCIDRWFDEALAKADETIDLHDVEARFDEASTIIAGWDLSFARPGLTHECEAGSCQCRCRPITG